MTDYVPPEFEAKGYHCPFCGVFAHQEFARYLMAKGPNQGRDLSNLGVSWCHSCEKMCVWKWWSVRNDRDQAKGTLIWPDYSHGPPANPDLPEDIKADFEEARSIATKSPRGAAALLRLCIQKLCREVGEKGKSINEDIGSLVKKGLPTQIQQGLDLVRVTGNEAVHPGKMDIKDDQEIVNRLFVVINLIANRLMSEPKRMQSMFDGLPQDNRDQIAKRDEAS